MKTLQCSGCGAIFDPHNLEGVFLYQERLFCGPDCISLYKTHVLATAVQVRKVLPKRNKRNKQNKRQYTMRVTTYNAPSHQIPMVKLNLCKCGDRFSVLGRITK